MNKENHSGFAKCKESVIEILESERLLLRVCLKEAIETNDPSKLASVIAKIELLRTLEKKIFSLQFSSEATY